MLVMKNMRIRSQAAEKQRGGRWQEKNVNYMQLRQERQEIRQERQGRVPPLRGDNFRQPESPQPSRNRSKSRNPSRDQSTPRRPRTPPRPPRRSPTPNRSPSPAQGSGARRVNTPPWREERGRNDLRHLRAKGPAAALAMVKSMARTGRIQAVRRTVKHLLFQHHLNHREDRQEHNGSTLEHGRTICQRLRTEIAVMAITSNRITDTILAQLGVCTRISSPL